MNHCEICGKLIDAYGGESQCLACRKDSASSPLKASGGDAVAPAAPVQEAIEVDEPALYSDVPCIRCRKHNALLESEFCLGCQLELLSLLGDAAHEIFQKPPPPKKPPVASAVSLMNDLEEKRERTATSHIRVVGASKLK